MLSSSLDLEQTRPHLGPSTLRVRAARKTYGHGPSVVHALREVTVEIGPGTFTAVMGPSGSGKSTFLQCAAGLDTLTSGQVWLGATEVSRLDEQARTLLRRERIGFVFQAFNLVPTLSVADNITLSVRLAGRRPDRAWLDELIDRLGLRTRLSHRPDQLSGGQQQRAAIARALLSKPAIVFADEPTGNLDTVAGNEVLTFLADAARQDRQTVVMVTHDPFAASRAERVIFFRDGQIVADAQQADLEMIMDTLRRIGRAS